MSTLIAPSDRTGTDWVIRDGQRIGTITRTIGGWLTAGGGRVGVATSFAAAVHSFDEPKTPKPRNRRSALAVLAGSALVYLGLYVLLAALQAVTS